MLGQSSKQNLWTPMKAQLGTLSRQSFECRDIQHLCLSSGFGVALLRQLLLLLSRVSFKCLSQQILSMSRQSYSVGCLLCGCEIFATPWLDIHLG